MHIYDNSQLNLNYFSVALNVASSFAEQELVHLLVVLRHCFG